MFIRLVRCATGATSTVFRSLCGRHLNIVSRAAGKDDDDDDDDDILAECSSLENKSLELLLPVHI